MSLHLYKENLKNGKWGLIVSIALWVGTPSWGWAALQLKMVSPVQSGGSITCQGPDYKGPENQYMAPFDKGGCQSCKQAVESAIQEANSALEAGKGVESGLDSQGSNGIQNNTANIPSQQSKQECGSGANNGQAADILGQQAANAGNVASQLASCPAKIDSACAGKVGGADQGAVESAKQSCQKAAQQAQQVASSKGADSSGMNSTGNQANSNCEKMGQMPQAPQPPQKKEDKPQQNPNSDISKPQELALDKNANSGVSFGPNTPLSDKYENTNGLNHSTPSYSSASGIGGLKFPRDLSSIGKDNTGSSQMKVPIVSEGGGGFGSSGHSGKEKNESNQKGASDAASAGVGDNSFQAVGGRSMLGLKSSGAELGDLNGLMGNNQAKLDGATDAHGEKVGEKQAASERSGEEDRSLFHMIHTKITEVARRQYLN